MASKSLKNNINTYMVIFLSLIITGVLIFKSLDTPSMKAWVLSIAVAAVFLLVFRKDEEGDILLIFNTVIVYCFSTLIVYYLFRIKTASDFYSIPADFFGNKAWWANILIFSGVASLIFGLGVWIVGGGGSMDAGDWFASLFWSFIIIAVVQSVLYLIYYLSGYSWSNTLAILGSAAGIGGIFLVVRRLQWQGPKYEVREPKFKGMDSMEGIHTRRSKTLSAEMLKFITSPLLVVALARMLILGVLWLPVFLRLEGLAQTIALAAFILYGVIEALVIYHQVRSIGMAIRAVNRSFPYR